jgi:hypothetical protein
MPKYTTSKGRPAVPSVLLLIALVSVGVSAIADVPMPGSPGLVLLAEYKFTALESEVAGLQPHPSDDDLFLVAANRRPAYASGQQPILPAEARGKLLTVNRHSGAIVQAVDLGGVTYGGIAYGDNAFFVSSLEPPEILKVEASTGRILRRIPLSGPAGGLAYDAARSRLLAQLYLGHPHIAVVDATSGATIDTLWSDESAMDLKLVGGDLLCTWVSSFDARAFGELRRIDSATGRVIGRMRLDDVHTSMGSLDPRVAGVEGFISLVRVNDPTGRVAVRRYRLDPSARAW